jgi:hypothetical protein
MRTPPVIGVLTLVSLLSALVIHQVETAVLSITTKSKAAKDKAAMDVDGKSPTPAVDGDKPAVKVSLQRSRSLHNMSARKRSSAVA